MPFMSASAGEIIGNLMQSDPQSKKKRLRVALWSTPLAYIFFVLRLHFLGDGPWHRYPWESPYDHTEYLSLSGAAKVAVPMALFFGLLIYFVYRPKLKHKKVKNGDYPSSD
jgi:hypothetical protein